MAKLRLGQLLLSSGVCDRESLLAAWQQKILYGHRLGTNLLALGGVSERDLALALGAQHGVHAAYGNLIKVDPAAAHRISSSVALANEVCPHHVDGDTLYLLMVDPSDAEARQEVEDITGLSVIPIVVCEARMWEILAFHHGGAPAPRHAHLEQPDPARSGEIYIGHSVGELTSEAEFEHLYTSRLNVPRHPDIPAYEDQPLGPADSDDTTLPLRAVTEDGPAESPEERWTVAPARGLLERRTHERPTPPGDEKDPSAFTFAAPGEIVVGVAHDPLPEHAMAHRTRPPTPTRSTAAPEPLSFEAALERLKAVASRDEIADVVLGYAMSRFKRAVLLTVYPTAFAVWKAVGDRLNPVELASLRLPRDTRSVFSLVLDTKSHYIGPLQSWSGHAEWVKHTGRAIPRSIAVFPVLVRGDVVNLLLVDNGHEEHVGSDVGELLILAQHIAKSYESMLSDKAA